MGRNEKCSWDDGKRAANISGHGYDFADLLEVFDGRFAFTRRDDRFAYGELRYNVLVEFRGRIINMTLTPRQGQGASDFRASGQSEGKGSLSCATKRAKNVKAVPRAPIGRALVA